MSKGKTNLWNGAIPKLLPSEATKRLRFKERKKMDEILKYGPKKADHPSIGKECKACHEEFKIGDITTLVTLGPGKDPEERAKSEAGKPYNAVAIEIHYDCAGY